MSGAEPGEGLTREAEEKRSGFPDLKIFQKRRENQVDDQGQSLQVNFSNRKRKQTG